MLRRQEIKEFLTYQTQRNQIGKFERKIIFTSSIVLTFIVLLTITFVQIDAYRIYSNNSPPGGGII